MLRINNSVSRIGVDKIIIYLYDKYKFFKITNILTVLIIIINK